MVLPRLLRGFGGGGGVASSSAAQARGCSDESIDEIAAFLGVGEQVAAMTAQAMGGSVKFEDALAARLNVMSLSRHKLDEFIAGHPAQLTKGIPELVRKLQAQGKAVFLVSGGFRQIIHPIAESLDIPVPDNVHANNLLFNDDGSYAGFDSNEFTSRSGGKAEAVRQIKVHLEARQPGAADVFIGYGGVVERLNIAAKADWYLYSIQPLIDALELPN
eukprot:gene12443-12580_t